MSPATKPSTASGPRRKSSKPSLVITLKLSAELLKSFRDGSIKEESPSKDSSKDSSSATSKTLPIAPNSNGDNPPESTSNTPVASGTPAPTSMPPPTEGVKKKGMKRGPAPAVGPDGQPKIRGKPGPKKKPRLEDGSVDHSGSAARGPNGTAAHKLGPKANQGAINAGLRALDRSGKPCRKWQKGSIKLKSFTGVVWEIPRWTAPPRAVTQISTEGSSDGSSKENKDSSQVESEKSEKDSFADTDMKNGITVASSPPPADIKVETPQATPAIAAPA